MRTFLAAIAASVLVLTGMSAAEAASPYKVSIKLNHTQSTAGAFIVVSGSVTGSKANGSSVRIQRKYVGGSWTTVGTDKISSNKYSARVETPRGGNTSFRVLKASSRTHRSGVSSTKTLKVYEWLYLANESGISQQGRIVSPYEAKLGSTLYTRSIDVRGEVNIAWKLGGQCKTFTTRADYTSTTDPLPGSVDLQVQRLQTNNDQLQNATTRAPNAGPVTITSSLASTKYLGIQVNNLGDNEHVLLGNPKVLCNLDHLLSINAGDF